MPENNLMLPNPLIVDHLPRGKYAAHVRTNRKIGDHKTLLTDALPLVNGILRLPAVWRVHLGRIGIPAHPQRKELLIGSRKKTIEFLFSNEYRTQRFTVEICQPGGHRTITERLRLIASSSQIEVRLNQRLPKDQVNYRSCPLH